ncbi:Protein of unknown function [Geodermatophilus africanus]|uniref:DUF3891 domain-containing protein n=1 Tax=Geodermatophilus africanus TaxID=1137993 RepID=A0A1H3K3K9_9ACTN|nr:DUF3891 family protein [Geodermatophilus africanus]SDY46802.1 Protein of unknown function [Geodermatophilus africanus]
MILSREDGALRLVRQVEHGRVAGELAAAWGNEDFELGGARAAVVTAAARHDEGWRFEDARVLYAEAARRPLHFLEIGTADHVRLYRRGVEKVAALDVYAGLLVGMHWTGLYRGRWSSPGTAGRLARTEHDRRLQDEVVRDEEQRWIDARRQAWDDDEPRSVFETRLWHHFDLLQFWDLLSLYLAVSPREPGAAGPAESWGPQLRDLEHRPRTVRLPAVASRPGGERTEVTAAVTAPARVTLDPFPLAAAIRVDLEVAVLPDRGWGRDEVAERVRTTPPSVVSWELVPPAGSPR